jgi:hypothetical protein
MAQGKRFGFEPTRMVVVLLWGIFERGTVEVSSEPVDHAKAADSARRFGAMAGLGRGGK